MAELRRRLGEPVGRVIGTLVAILLLVWAGRTATTRPELAAVVALAVLALGLTLVEPALVPLVALPLLVIVTRVQLYGVNLSLSDFLLFIATWPAFLLAKRPYTREMRVLFTLTSIYQFATLLTVFNNPYSANIVEWFHAGMLVGGGLAVGWIVARQGHGRLGLRLILVAILVISLATVAQGALHWARGDFSAVYPAWPFPMHKNFAGTLAGLGAGVVYTRPVWLGWGRRLSWAVFSVMALAVLFTQSRQALVGLAAVIFVVVLRGKGEHRRSKLVLLIVAPALVFVTKLVQDQVESGNQFNSVFQRLTWFQDSFAVWQSDPWFGVGLRWWYTDRFPVSFQPPNAEVEVLTSAGIIGLIAFLTLMVGAVIVLSRVDPVYGTVALTILVNRLVQAQFDLFWAAVQASIPFVVIGIALGVQGLDVATRTPARVEEIRELTAR